MDARHDMLAILEDRDDLVGNRKQVPVPPCAPEDCARQLQLWAVVGVAVLSSILIVYITVLTNKIGDD